MFESIILASTSPRRQALIKKLFSNVRVQGSNADEKIKYISPQDLINQLATLKATSVAATNYDSLVLGADTIVVLDGNVLNKPIDIDNARQMLKSLSGKRHQVMTGVCLCFKGNIHSFIEESTVQFFDLTECQIESYLATGSSLDKAGAYGLQDSNFVKNIVGSSYNVVGLPIERLKEEIEKVDKEWNNG